MIRVRQFHIRADDTISGILRTTSPPELPLQVYLTSVNMTAFIREVRRKDAAPNTYMFRGVVHYGCHDSVTIQCDCDGFVATEVLPYINAMESEDVKTQIK